MINIFDEEGPPADIASGGREREEHLHIFITQEHPMIVMMMSGKKKIMTEEEEGDEGLLMLGWVIINWRYI